MELLILVSDFMVNYTLKILKGISMKYMECLNEDAKEKIKIKDRSCTSWVGTIKSLLVPDCLILHTSLINSILI